jgi:hypothetical protein
LEKQFLIDAYEHLVMLVVPEEHRAPLVHGLSKNGLGYGSWIVLEAFVRPESRARV